MFCLEKYGKLWFCTNNTKDVYREMKENPRVEISVSSATFSWIRLNGQVVFENNLSIKEDCMNIPTVKGVYETPDNPIFEVFYLENTKAIIADMSGNAPKEYALQFT